MRATIWSSARGASRVATLGIALTLALGGHPGAVQAGVGAVLAAFAVGKSAAAAAAQNSFGGRVLSVDQATVNGRTVYRVKLLLDGGVIKIVTVDGESGKVT